MEDFPSNLNHSIIPFGNPESSFVVPVVLYIDSYGINHLAYPLMEEASTQGGRSNKSLGSDLGEETNARRGNLYLRRIRFQSRLSVISCQPIAMILPEAQENSTSDPSVKALVRVTRSVQRTRDEAFLARSTKKTRPMKSKFVPPSNPIDIDDDIVESKKSRKRKRNTSETKESDPKETDEIDSARVLSSRRRSVIRGRVITVFGSDEMSELLVLLQPKDRLNYLFKGTIGA
ncbi:hypothetical protein KY289_016288 [Solanum tuberosum]|nr:hypothetical protein KY289_016288 [Solanum tuberosum]